uniref:Uncharacterized protein n=1 Tax=Romanomermis culicivorax TaxID=13658 RepID=A0A915K5K3_ROMCU
MEQQEAPGMVTSVEELPEWDLSCPTTGQCWDICIQGDQCPTKIASATFCRYNVDHCLETLCGKLKTFTRRPDCKKDKVLQNEMTSILKKCEDVEECFSYQPLITPKLIEKVISFVYDVVNSFLSRLSTMEDIFKNSTVNNVSLLNQ